MSTSDILQVKVDNWGIYFLQRLKHFFNRTDYCDLTLQFQDNSRLKVHRLVLSACTEYFEILERSCEMYEDCLVMPDDLQADVVLPIVNFMYTGQLEFHPELLHKLYQTAQVMNMTVLTKLLISQLELESVPVQRNNISNLKSKPVARKYEKSYNKSVVKQPLAKKQVAPKPVYQPPSQKRSHLKAFDGDAPVNLPQKKPTTSSYHLNQKSQMPAFDPRPTRYELPEELDTDNIFEDNSFANISYTSQPLMVHPETSKKYSINKPSLFSEPSSSNRLSGTSTMDIIECPKMNHNFYDEEQVEETEFYSLPTTSEEAKQKDSSQLFDEILVDNSAGPKVTIEAPEQQADNIDHAKIISEVLKKYPHLMKSNKNIKLRILDNKPKPVREKIKIKKEVNENEDYSYEPVLDSKQAARLISLGAENINGPWICLICGTPGKALHFPSYLKYRRHLVEVHKEKPVSTMCEYCGHKSNKRNYLLHHMYTKHGVEPPLPYHFPKCDECDYIALTESFMYKHKMNHSVTKSALRCPECNIPFKSMPALCTHMKMNGHRYSHSKTSLSPCIYCNKNISHIYQHLKYNHAAEASADGVVVFSDDEEDIDNNMKVKQSESDNEEDQYEIIERPDGKIAYLPKKMATTIKRQKILNPGFKTTEVKATTPVKNKMNNSHKFKKIVQVEEVEQEVVLPVPKRSVIDENVLIIDGKEYVIKNNSIVPRIVNENIIHNSMPEPESIIPEMVNQEIDENMASTSMNFALNENVQYPRNIVFKKSNMNQPIQIVVSNDHEYKALMNANQTVTYDGNYGNKTLTVLTTAHNANINNTPMELENVPDNNMMIYQNSYPISTSDAVTNKNNYVVVYTPQPMSQSKQIQIMTSSNIAVPQYIQPIQTATPTYNTLTTSAQIIDHNGMQETIVSTAENPHLAVLLPQVDMQQEIIENIAVPTEELASTHESEPVIMEEHENDQHITEYTENVIEEQQQEIETNESVVLTQEPCETISQINTNTLEETEEPVQFVNTSPTEEVQLENEETECLEQIENNTETVTTEETENDMSIETAQDENVIADIPETVEIEVEKQPEIITPNVNTDQLVADWSEEEEETNRVEEESPDIEESIENIQQEVDKQIVEPEIEPQDNSEQDNITESVVNEEIETNTETVNTTVTAPPVKIASLLNDWDENDSQDEEPLTDKTEEKSSEDVTENVTVVQENVSQDESDASKTDGIQEQIEEAAPPAAVEAPEGESNPINKLVSDWDEEDEEADTITMDTTTTEQPS